MSSKETQSGPFFLLQSVSLKLFESPELCHTQNDAYVRKNLFYFHVFILEPTFRPASISQSRMSRQTRKARKMFWFLFNRLCDPISSSSSSSQSRNLQSWKLFLGPPLFFKFKQKKKQKQILVEEMLNVIDDDIQFRPSSYWEIGA